MSQLLPLIIETHTYNMIQKIHRKALKYSTKYKFIACLFLFFMVKPLIYNIIQKNREECPWLWAEKPHVEMRGKIYKYI